MIFSSLEFIFLFLPITLLLFYGLGSRIKVNGQRWILLVASVIFYASWNYKFLLLLSVSIIGNFYIGRVLSEHRSKKSILAAGIAFNLLPLIFFKYSYFVSGNLFFDLSVEVENYLRHLIIPLGISFYTFQQIAYLVDVKTEGKARRHLRDYAIFVSFFPQLIAGPIVHHYQVLPQIQNASMGKFNPQSVYTGIFYLLCGLFQKLVIANFLAVIADKGFEHAYQLTILEAWGSTLSFAFQIYFDFAGYSNMAIGLGLMFNIRLPINFNSPYQAISIIDFWKRWHITLSLFLRDYLYIPLGGNRCSAIRQGVNIMVVMLLGGLWHGASWTFVIWGGYHGMMILINHMWLKTGIRLSKWLSGGLTFLFVVYGWVFFRCANFDEVIVMTRSLLGFNGWNFSDLYFLWKTDFVALFIIAMGVIFIPNAEYWAKKIKPRLLWNSWVIAMYAIVVLFMNRSTAFIYFQF